MISMPGFTATPLKILSHSQLDFTLQRQNRAVKRVTQHASEKKSLPVTYIKFKIQIKCLFITEKVFLSPFKALLYLVCLEEFDGSGNVKLAGHKKLYSCGLGHKPCTVWLLPATHFTQELLHSLDRHDGGDRRLKVRCWRAR